MTSLAALGFAFTGSVIGSLAGIFVTVAHPVYLKHWHDLQKAKESRRRVTEALDGLVGLAAKVAEREHQKRKQEDLGRG